MGLFDRKYCDICGEKIGLLGNRKLEDGNLCKNCAAKLSPWFSDRRSSTVSQIREQLEYRERNLDEVRSFHATQSFGRGKKLMIDDDRRKFLVASSSNLESANPDVLDFSQIVGYDFEIDEDRDEQKKTVDGKSVSYDPPRYEYSYDFYVTIRVDHPYFDEMRFQLNSGSVRTGNRSMNGPSGNMRLGTGADEYFNFVDMGNEIKEKLHRMQHSSDEPEVQEPDRAESAAQESAEPGIAAGAPAGAAAKCPWCGAVTAPGPDGSCPLCSGPMNG